MDFAQTHPFLRTYLRYVENTESPRIFHVWAALSSISAALGRRCWFPTGIGPVYPNMYVVLCGPPATRKGAAIKFSKSLLEKHTGVRFAPNDTGGQRQGLIAAMTDVGKDEADDELTRAFQDTSNETFETLGSMMNGHETKDIIEKLNNIEFDVRDPRTMYIVAGELNSILGENNTQMLTFLQEMWDGVPYRYKLRNTQYEIKDGLLSILGGTTPSQIALSMPPEAIGQGFTSRIIFVYADKQFARIPRPSLDEPSGCTIGAIYGSVYNRFEGPFQESEGAAKLIDEFYMRGITMKDPRFLHYADRRGDHLKKIAMCLAAGRGFMSIEPDDVRLADQLLLYTENYMADALGEYGMNKLGAAKQKLLDILRASDDAIPVAALFGLMSKDMNKMDFQASISELHNSGKITYLTLPEIGQCVIAADESGAKKAKKEMREIARLMEGDKRYG